MTYGHRNGSDRIPVIPTGTATAQGKAPQAEPLKRRAAETHVGVLQWAVLLTACIALLIGCGTKTTLSSGEVATSSSASTSSASPASTSATPNFSPAPGVYNSAQTITISAATPGATIYYTTDGSTPTTSSLKYTGPIVAGSTATIKAISSASGYANSVPATAAYIISAPGTITTTTATKTVTISDATTGATIYYTLDGSTPTTSSTRYTGPITVDSTVTIKAIAIAKGHTPSAVGAVTVSDPSLQQAASPTISPAAGTYLRALMVTISDVTPGSVIYYTTNGTVPTTKSTQYTSAIDVTSTTTIQAIAVASGYANSPVASATFTMN